MSDIREFSQRDSYVYATGEQMWVEETFNTCERCEKRIMHTNKQCGYVTCPDGSEHDILSSYQNYGYWSARCTKCKRHWEVDSSG